MSDRLIAKKWIANKKTPGMTKSPPGLAGENLE